MCLLTFIPEYVTPDTERFDVAAISNPDGFGWAIVDGSRVIRGRGMRYEQVLDQFMNTRRRYPGVAMFHFRWATHGEESAKNCHPFILGSDEASVMGHNGILPVDVPKGSKRSDTAEFASRVFPATARDITALDDAKYVEDLSAWAKGNKLVFLTANSAAKSNYYIINESEGHWDKDMWWSNYSYEYTPSRFYSMGDYGYGTGYYGSGYTARMADVEPVKLASTSIDQSSWDPFDEDFDDEAVVEMTIHEELEQMSVYSTDAGNGKIYVECYTCAHAKHYPMEYIALYCEECAACLFCGSASRCSCWRTIEEELDVANFNATVMEIEHRTTNTGGCMA
jgi:predicted glutamine amidotransferase